VYFAIVLYYVHTIFSHYSKPCEHKVRPIWDPNLTEHLMWCYQTLWLYIPGWDMTQTWFVCLPPQGKFIRVHFGNQGKIAGADIEFCEFTYPNICSYIHWIFIYCTYEYNHNTGMHTTVICTGMDTQLQETVNYKSTFDGL